MKYPDDFVNKIICGDCLEVMKQIPDKSVDLVLTDPPYNMGYSGRGIVNKFTTFENDVMDEQAHTDWFNSILQQLNRVLKDNTSIYIYIDFRNYARIYSIVSKYFSIKNCIVWDKGSIGMGQHYRFQHEFIIYAIKGNFKLIIDKRNVSDIWQFNREPATFYQHPTQKPLYAMKKPLKHATIAGNIVLDPFLGSGTTAVACKELGRKYIGIEISPEYCKIANERLRQEVFPI